MCESITVDMQSVITEISRRKKEEERKKKPQDENIMSAYAIHRAAIIN